VKHSWRPCKLTAFLALAALLEPIRITVQAASLCRFLALAALLVMGSFTTSVPASNAAYAGACHSAPSALSASSTGVVALTGRVTREGTQDYSRTTVTALLFPSDTTRPPRSWSRVCTNTQGDFTLLLYPEEKAALPPDMALPAERPSGATSTGGGWVFIRLDFPNYGSECHWKPVDGEVVKVGWHNLEGGDVNKDGCINIYDIVRIIADFGNETAAPCFVPYTPCPPPDPAAEVAPASDVNGDCRVNIFDLSIAAENFTLCSNCP